MRARSLTFLPLLAALAAFSGAPSAAETARLLAPDGAVLEVRESILGSGEVAGQPQVQALTVTVTRQGASPVVEVVPGTEGEAPESLIDAALSHGGTKLTAFWLGREGNGDRRLFARTRDTEFGGWSEQRELLVADLAADAPEPVWAVTLDQYTIAAEDGSNPVRHQREVLHLFWWALREGRPSLRYSPVVLVDGLALGSVPNFALDQIDSAATFATVATDRLFRSLAVVRNGDEPRLGVAFLGPSSGRLLGAELQLLPGELSLLADRARGHIIDLGAALYPGQMATFAERARGHIIDLSSQLHPASARFAADGVKELVEGFDTVAGLNALADRARGHIIDLVGSPIRGGIATEAAASVSSLYEVPEVGADGSTLLNHLIQARALRSWSLPVESVGSEFVSLVSARGDAAILAWRAQADTLVYLESDGEAFGEARQIPLGSLDLEAALGTLKARLDAR